MASVADGTDFWEADHSTDPVDAGDRVAPLVLHQAVGAKLADGEAVACARFIVSSRGRIIGTADWGTHLAVVTDRRVIRVSGWTLKGYGRLLDSYGSSDGGGEEWRAGIPLGTGFITRYSVWHGLTSGARLTPDWPGLRRLVIATRGRGRQVVVARTEAATALHEALTAALAGPGALELPAAAPG